MNKYEIYKSIMKLEDYALSISFELEHLINNIQNLREKLRILGVDEEWDKLKMLDK